MKVAERMQWVSLALGVAAAALALPAWIALVPIYFVLGLAAVSVGLIADRRASALGMKLRTPAHIGMFTGAVCVGATVLIVTGIRVS